MSQQARQLADLLAAHYGLADTVYTPIDAGMMNDNYRVQAQGRCYSLKCYRPGIYEREQIEWACEVQTRLRRAGLPVGAIVPARDGALLVDQGETRCVLAEWLPGRSAERGTVPADRAREMGLMLGRLLLELARIEPVRPWSVTPPERAQVRLSELLSLAAAGTRPLDAVAADLLRYKLAALERIARIVPQLAALSVQWVHGDYHDANVLFSDRGSITGIIDFDNLRCRPRGQEVMRALAICFEPGSPEALAFFRGYAEVVRPPAEEVALYVPMWTYIDIVGTWPVSDRYLHPDAYQERWDRFIRPPSDWWERHSEDMTERFLAELGAPE